MTDKLIEHLEHYLGKIVDGWRPSDASQPSLFQVVRYSGGFAGSAAFSTIGLSKYVLSSRVSGKKVRCELIMMARDSAEWIPGLLDQIGGEIAKSGLVPLRGDVIGPRGRIAEKFEMTSFYASIPIYLPDEFAVCELEDGERVVFIWLFPLYNREAEFINQKGWEKFEDELERQDPDLLDMRRKAMIGP